jgi:hypothetical protein
MSIRMRTRAALPADDYELRLHGSGVVVLSDLQGQSIDGDGDGNAGGDAVIRFRVSGEQP